LIYFLTGKLQRGRGLVFFFKLFLLQAGGGPTEARKETEGACEKEGSRRKAESAKACATRPAERVKFFLSIVTKGFEQSDNK